MTAAPSTPQQPFTAPTERPADAHVSHVVEGHDRLRPLLILCGLGLLLRLAFLWMARGIDFVADEGFYVQSALAWNHFGFYSDQYRYLWPPGYPFFLAQCLALFESGGLLAAKLIQVLASASVGLSTMLIARSLFGTRAARTAGLIWAFYLPLIGFTHTLWSETLFLAFFLPGVLQLLTFLDEGRGPDSTRRLVTAGLCLALALYLKQAVLPLVPLLALLLFLRTGPAIADRAWAASLFLLAALTPVLPWSLRNVEVYDRVVPMGATLGENAYRGLIAHYTIFDTALVAAKVRASGERLPPPRAASAPSRRPAWTRPEDLPNTVDRQREGLSRGLAFARGDLLWLVRSRLQKLADWVAPVSFFTRHQALDAYVGTPLGRPTVRRATTVWALLCPVAVLGLTLLGAVRMHRGPGRALFALLFAYFSMTALVVAMSRFRMPVVPLCIVLAAGALSKRPLTRPLILGVGWALLAGLWWIDLPVVLGVAQRAWEGAR